MTFHPARIAIVSALALLAACGGGGGNPGVCTGSEEVCERPTGTGGSGNVVPASVGPSVPATTTTTSTTPTLVP